MRFWRREAKSQPPVRWSGGNPARVSARYDKLRAESEVLRAEVEALATNAPVPESLTAAGQHVLNGQATLLRRLVQSWQIRAFGYYDLLGEIKYASQFYSRSLSNLRLYPAYREDNGDLRELGAEGGPTPTADERVVIDALARIRDPGGGGRSGLLTAYGRLMFIVGETYLFVSENPETGLEQWEMLSTDELRLNDGLYTRYKSPSLAATQFMPAPDDKFVLVGTHPNATAEERAAAPQSLPEAVAYRLWRRHPRFSDLADSTMQGVLELCEELVLLTNAVRARAQSRLAGSGVLFLDTAITTRPLEAVPDEDPLEDVFFNDLTDAMTSAITDIGTAASVVPLIARVSVPEGKKLSDLVYHLQIIDPMQVYPETGLRLECIRRIATGLDMPSEILEGMTDANHWTAWMVDEQSWKAHLQPVAQQLVEDLTSAYLTPYLKSEQDERRFRDFDRYVIAYDASAVLNHPDRFKDARDAYDRESISKQALREAGGFDEDDAMPEDERAERIGIKTHDSSLAWFGMPSPRSGGVEVSPGVVETGGTGQEGPPPASGEKGAKTGAEAEKGPPKGGSTEPVPEDVIGSAKPDAVLVSRIEGAACLALLRARDAAGARIRTACNREHDEEALSLIDGLPAREVAATLGNARVRKLLGGSKEAELVASARPLILDALRMIGVADDVAVSIAATVERQAVRTLYQRGTAAVALNGAFTEFVKGLLTAKGR